MWPAAMNTRSHLDWRIMTGFRIGILRGRLLLVVVRAHLVTLTLDM